MLPEFGMTLSREETLLVVRILQGHTVFGVEGDPEDSTAKDRYQAFMQAERALRARGLAQIDQHGQLKLLRPVAEALATCTYPDHSLVIHHWTVDNTLIQCFGHQRANQRIVHHHPQPYLHQFDPVTQSKDLIIQLLNHCACDALIPGHGDPFQLSFDVLHDIRESAYSAEQLTTLLTEQGCTPATVDQLSAMFLNPYALTIIHSLHAQQYNEAIGYAWSILHSEYGAWMMYQQDHGLYQLQPTSTEHVVNTLTAALTQNPVALAA